jgi:hypothetical protein
VGRQPPRPSRILTTDVGPPPTARVYPDRLVK